MTKLQDAINTAWDEAEELHSGLEEMTDEEVIETRKALKKRAYNIMWALNEYAEGAWEKE